MLSASASAIFISATDVYAQAASPLQAGARVSVVVPDTTCRRRWRPCDVAAALSGTLVRATADTLVLQIGPTSVVPMLRGPGHRVYVRTRASRVRTAFWSALSYGVAAGVLVAQTDASQRSQVQTAGGVAVFGLALGAIVPAYRWRRVAP
jgi:hypothetical protein